ncbi:MAG: DEAD/DEAH box helicase, partial [Actinomycetia bacterium]|nr:DEAD/DEAH box helicase [Actinomycetes bacterium]
KMKKIKFDFVLRDYQREALEAIWNSYKSGIRRQLISLPTGCGKTVIFSFLPRYFKMKKKMLVLAHREELLFQAKDKIVAINKELKLNVGIEKAVMETDYDDDIIIASVQTIGRGNERIKKFNPDDFSIIVVDEAHHAVAPTYKAILKHFGIFDKDTDKLLLGFTATPKRGDGIGLEEIFEDITYSQSITHMIEANYLANIIGYRVNTKVNLEGVKVRMGDFVIGDLSRKVNVEERNALIIKSYLKLAKNRKTVVFCTNVAHAKQVALIFNKHKIKAVPVWGNMPSKNRAAVLKKFKNDKIDVITNCNLLTEGFDEPGIDCIIMARPTKSQLLYTQMIGRGTRPFPNKENLMVIDISDNST